MKKIFIALFAIAALASCADQVKRKEYVEQMFPKYKVEPATGLIQQSGYQFVLIDSTNQIIAVAFYPMSETKIASLRNIR